MEKRVYIIFFDLSYAIPTGKATTCGAETRPAWLTNAEKGKQMVKIRLKRTGTKNWISFRVVVCDIRSQRDGYMVEELGYYDPRRSDEKLNVERLEYWVSKGAQMSETVESIYKRAKDGKSKVRGVPDAKPRKKNFKKNAEAAS